MVPKASPPEEPASARHIVLIATFALFLAVPSAVTVADILNGPDSAQDERRASTPELPTTLGAIPHFLGDTKWYFQRRFGLRMWLTQLHGRIMVELLGVTANDKVVLGRESWLFTAGDHSVEDYRGIAPLTDGEVTQLAAELRRRSADAARRGVPYLVAFCPDKHTIYPEYMPRRIRNVGNETRLDQVTARLLEEGAVDFIDLRPTLRQAKKQARVYHRSDTHWNSLGAYAAAQAIAKRLRKRLPEIPAPATSLPPIRATRSHGGDLSRMLGLQERWVEELLEPDLSVANLTVDGRPWVAPPTHDVITRRSPPLDNASAPAVTLSLVHDSFGVAVTPWLAQFFSRTVLHLGYRLPEEALVEGAPRAVVQLLVERKIRELIHPERGAPLLIGDSLTAAGDWGAVFRDHVNAGVNGDTAKGVAARIAAAAAHEPRQVFIMVGINDLARGTPVGDIVLQVEAALATVRHVSPRSQIILQSVLPVGARARHAEGYGSVPELNQRLRTLASRQRADYLDLHRLFADEHGAMQAALTEDGVHLTTAGYARWLEALRARYVRPQHP